MLSWLISYGPGSRHCSRGVRGKGRGEREVTNTICRGPHTHTLTYSLTCSLTHTRTYTRRVRTTSSLCPWFFFFLLQALSAPPFSLYNFLCTIKNNRSTCLIAAQWRVNATMLVKCSAVWLTYPRQRLGKLIATRIIMERRSSKKKSERRRKNGRIKEYFTEKMKSTLCLYQWIGVH